MYNQTTAHIFLCIFETSIYQKMKQKSFFQILAICLLCSNIGLAQIKVVHVTDGVDLEGKSGLFYALPRTLIKVDITVDKTEYYAGPYAAYAGKYLDLENVSTNDYNEFAISQVKLSSMSEPDPDHFYFTEVDAKSVKKGSAMLLSMSEAGLITGFDGNVEKSIIEEKVTHLSDIQNIYAGLFGYSAETNLYERSDTITRKVVVDTVTVEKKYVDKKWVEKSTEQKASEAAKMVTKLRDNRINLLTGYQEVAFDAGTMAYMDKQIKTLEDEYLSLFIGITVNKRLHYSFTILPESDTDFSEIPVFVFSDRTGIKDKSSPGGDLIKLKINLADSLGVIASAVNGKNKEVKGDKGFSYRIPAMARVSVEINSDLKSSGVFPISQFGIVDYLPSSFTNVRFSKETGGIMNIIIE